MRQGQKRGVKRFGVAHGLRLTPTMEYVIKQYAGQVGVSLSDAMRLLLEQATSQRVNAVEAQAERLARIEAKLDDLAGGLGHVEGVAEAILITLDPRECEYEEEESDFARAVRERIAERYAEEEADPFGPEGKYGPGRATRIAQMTQVVEDLARADAMFAGEALSPEEQAIWDAYAERGRVVDGGQGG